MGAASTSVRKEVAQTQLHSGKSVPLALLTKLSLTLLAYTKHDKSQSNSAWSKFQPQQHNQEECAKQYVGCVSQILLPGSILVCAAGSLGLLNSEQCIAFVVPAISLQQFLCLYPSACILACSLKVQEHLTP